MIHRSTSRTSLSRRECLGWLLASSGLGFSGCVNVAAMASKMIQGDPETLAAFTVTTGVDLLETESEIAVHVSAPSTVCRDYATLTFDLEQELRQRLRFHELQSVDPNEVANVLDAKGLQFDPQLIARSIKTVDYVFHIHLETFKLYVDNSPTLLQGLAHGTVSGFAVETSGGSKDKSDAKDKKTNSKAKADDDQDDLPVSRAAVQVYEKEFELNHPRNHPIPIDQTPINTFRRKFLNKLADHLGNQFYPVKTADLI